MLLPARGAGVSRWRGEGGFCKLASSVGSEELPQGARHVLAASLFFTVIVLLGASRVSASDKTSLSLTNMLSVPRVAGKQGQYTCPSHPLVTWHKKSFLVIDIVSWLFQTILLWSSMVSFFSFLPFCPALGSPLFTIAAVRMGNSLNEWLWPLSNWSEIWCAKCPL